jgi:two-component system, NarL family, sensor histidine kinase DesK
VTEVTERSEATRQAQRALAGPTFGTPRARLGFIWVWAGVWLVYMVEPLHEAWHRPQTWERLLGLAAVIGFCGLYGLGFAMMRRSIRRTGQRQDTRTTAPLLVAIVTLSALLGLAIGEDALGTLVYVAVIAVFGMPGRFAWPVVLLCVAATVGLPRLIDGWKPNDDLAVSVFVAGLAVTGVVQIMQRNAQLAAAHAEIARLAVADERNRFARDLHDLLGHSLTVVSVKTELAARMVRLAPERAEAELADVQRLAREALADVRAAVAGYRGLSLDAELAAARTALDAAGIEADLPHAGSAVPPERQELFAWAIREAVTNVVRHSQAKHCRIELTPTSLTVVDDGRGPTAGAADGHGLAGLRERVDTAGGTLSVASAPDGGFVLRVVVPEGRVARRPLPEAEATR